MKFFEQAGVTLIELLVAMAILVILASLALPLSHMSEQREREIMLRQKLRGMRQAIDRFKHDWDLRRISHLESNVANPENGYPTSLDILVNGAASNNVESKTRKYLRRILEDPVTGKREWGLRCYVDEAGSDQWCGKDVFDLYSLSDKTALDGTRYRDW